MWDNGIFWCENIVAIIVKILNYIAHLCDLKFRNYKYLLLYSSKYFSHKVNLLKITEI